MIASLLTGLSKYIMRGDILLPFEMNYIINMIYIYIYLEKSIVMIHKWIKFYMTNPDVVRGDMTVEES